MNVIFGAGDYGKRLYEYAKTNGMEIDYFCQTYVSEDEAEYLGVKLISIDDLAAVVDKETVIYIALFDYNTRKTIGEDLLDILGDEVNIIDCGDFIRNNFTNEKPRGIYYERNEYEKGVAKAYWSKLLSDRMLLERAIDSLISGMADIDVDQVKCIISRMRDLSNEADENVLFNSTEKKNIRKMEREFSPHRIKDELWGELHVWNGWKFPGNAYMDPSVWYYQSGMNVLKHTNRIRNKCIIDAGAYIGDSSIVLSRYTDNRVYAFEASYNNYIRIDDVCRMNKVLNVVPINRALSNKKGKEELYMAPNGVGNGILKREAYSYCDITVTETISLDDFAKENRLNVGLIKADIEGGEPKLIEGARNIIKDQSPTLLISIYHTASDFFSIKGMIEDINSNYRFRIFQPFSRNRVIRDTLLICEVE